MYYQPLEMLWPQLKRKKTITTQYTKIVFWLEERYGNIYSEDMEREGNVSTFSGEGYAILFDVCRVLNTVTWPTLSDDVEDDITLLEKQIVFNAIKLQIWSEYSGNIGRADR